MKLFETFFGHPSNSEEKQLVMCLKEISDVLRANQPHWSNILANFQSQLANEIAENSPIQTRYLTARKIESVFGGMGSLNDIPLTGNCERLRGQLFTAVTNVLRFYWRALGNESNDEKFGLLPVGASVRLVPGKILYFERNEKPVLIDYNSKAVGQVWCVVSYAGPDITNMPSYEVRHENTFMIARHECLEQIS
jgi:hypothetical protein